jgi:hypothetical protein
MFRQITIAYFALAAPSTMLEAYVAISTCQMRASVDMWS